MSEGIAQLRPAQYDGQSSKSVTIILEIKAARMVRKKCRS